MYLTALICNFKKKENESPVGLLHYKLMLFIWCELD